MPALLQACESPSCGTSRSGRSGPRLGSVASPRGSHSASRVASTMPGFSASVSPFPTANTSWGQSSMPGSLPGHASPALSRSLATHFGGFKCTGRCVASFCSCSAPSGYKLRSRMCEWCLDRATNLCAAGTLVKRQRQASASVARGLGLLYRRDLALGCGSLVCANRRDQEGVHVPFREGPCPWVHALTSGHCARSCAAGPCPGATPTTIPLQWGLGSTRAQCDQGVLLPHSMVVGQAAVVPSLYGASTQLPAITPALMLLQ